MKKIISIYFPILCTLGMLGACTSADDWDGTQATAPTDAPYTVRFSLGGSAGQIAASRAARTTEAQTPAEKSIHSLYAVIFKDLDASSASSTGQQNCESNEDTFYALYRINLSGHNGTDDALKDFSFSLATEGHFNICFVANPDGAPSDEENEAQATGLAQKLHDLTSETSTVADFKATLTQEKLAAVAPQAYLMISPFYSVASSFDTPQTIEQVDMKRAMARFDLTNEADGYVITQVVFHNRAVSTPLITDNPSGTTTQDTEQTTYSMGDGLVGSSSKPTACTATIYSYEQYKGSGQTAGSPTEGQPYLEINYRIPTDEPDRIYTHNVYFTSAADGSAAQYLPVKRNTLYRINMQNDPNTKIRFQVTVADWNTAEQVIVSDDDLAQHVSNHLDPRFAKIGYYYLADGTVCPPVDLKENDLRDVIGIVFSTDPDRIGTAEKAALAERGVDTPHGLALAVKDAAANVAWYDLNNYVELPTEIIKQNVCDLPSDINGLQHVQTILSLDAKLEHYPAIKAAQDYNQTRPAPAKSSGWFLPSAGQWWDIIANLALPEIKQMKDYQFNDVTIDYGRGEDDGTYNIYVNKDNGYIDGQLNKALAPLGTYADSFVENIDYFSSTAVWQDESNRVYSIWSPYMMEASFTFDCTSSINENGKVRPIVAF